MGSSVKWGLSPALGLSLVRGNSGQNPLEYLFNHRTGSGKVISILAAQVCLYDTLIGKKNLYGTCEANVHCTSGASKHSEFFMEINEVLSLCCYWRDRKIFLRLHLGKDKLSKDPRGLTKNPNHFWKVKYGAQGITSTLHRTYFNMLFLVQKLSISNYFGLIILLSFSAFQFQPRGKKRFSTKRKHNWIKCI